MTEKSKKIFSHNLPKREQDMTPRPSGGFISTSKPVGMTPDAYIGKYATEEEKAELIKKIEERRAKLPKFVYLICPKCGHRNKLPYGDRDIRDPRPDYCLRCNPQLYTDGAIQREMTKKEIAQFEKDEKATYEKNVGRATKAAFFARNQKRQEQGLKPLTMAQFKEEERRHYLESIQGPQKVKK